MDRYVLQDQLKSKKVTDLNVRVVYYVRVSTDSDEQLNSLKNQKDYYENYIKNNTNWIFSGGYIDEGISGINTKNRDRFNDMLDDAKEDKFDYVITKEISRFARNTLDSIKYTRELLNYGVGVWFQEDNINTADTDGELRLTIMSAMAQDESRRLSRRVKFGHKQAIKNGSVLGNSRMYGYRHNKAKLVIDEDEAKMVRLIFDLYSSGDNGLRKIEDTLFEKGYRSRKGKRIDRNVIANIIQNPKYKGYYCGNKVEVIDLFSKEQKFKSPDEWVMWKDEEGTTVPAIVSEELWGAANKIFEERSAAVKQNRDNKTHQNLFTSKIVCTEHNCSYHLKSRVVNGNLDNRWGCKIKLREGANKCDSFYIKESELVNVLNDIMKEYSLNYEKIINSYIKYVNKSLNKTEINKKIKIISDEINDLNNKKDTLLNLVLKNLISEKEFIKRNEMFNVKLQENEKELSELQKKIDNNHDEQITKMRNLARQILKESTVVIDKQIVEALIDKIYVTPIDENHMKLRVSLNFGGDREMIYDRSSNTHMFSLENMGLTIYTKENKEFVRKGIYGTQRNYYYNIELSI